MTYQTSQPIEHITLTTSNRQAREIARLITDQGDLSPIYQRASVWTAHQRVGLIRSWLSGIPVPAVVLNNRDQTEFPHGEDGLPEGGAIWAVVDGKQRIETAILWFDSKFAAPASWFNPEWIDHTEETDDGTYVRFNGLTVVGQRLFSNRALLPEIETTLGSVRAEADLYLLLNGAGTPQSDTDMINAAQVAGR